MRRMVCAFDGRIYYIVENPISQEEGNSRLLKALVDALSSQSRHCSYMKII